MVRKPALDDVVIGLAVVAFAAVVGYETNAMQASSIYAKVGPKVFPWLVTGMLAALGGLLLLQAFTGGWEHEHEHGRFDWPSIAWLGLGLLLNVVLIDRAGFIIASTCLFVCTARAFGSRAILRDAGIGFLLALVAYVGFDRVLGYKIGSGLIESFI